MEKSRPLIGITVSRLIQQDGRYLSLPEAYAAAIQEAGGNCILLPPSMTKDSLTKVLPLLDGILLSGGGDVHPSRYGGTNHTLISNVHPDRDHLEIELVAHAYQYNLPLLGICRGLQVINIAMGGTIYEDLIDQRPASINHQTTSDLPRFFLAHPVVVSKTSRLFEILKKERFPVNSHHHQGIRELASRLFPSTFAPDGLIEGIEIPDHRFFLAVQWHPECMLPQENMNALFSAFIQSTRIDV